MKHFGQCAQSGQQFMIYFQTSVTTPCLGYQYKYNIFWNNEKTGILRKVAKMRLWMLFEERSTLVWAKIHEKVFSG